MSRFFLVLVVFWGVIGQYRSSSAWVSQETMSASTAFSPFGTVTLAVDFVANGTGSNVDTIAFWEAPSANDSLMFVSAKSSQLVEVWQYPYADSGSELAPLTHSCIDQGTNGVIVDQAEDLLYVSVVETTKVCVFSVPDLIYVTMITTPERLNSEPNLALLELDTSEKRLYISDDDMVYIIDPVSGTLLSTFTPVAGLETMVGDNYAHMLYIPDENDRTGIYAYDATGNRMTRNDQSKLGDSTIFDADAEGIIIYTCPSANLNDDGRGFIVVSDQISSASRGNDYEFFDRQTWEYLGKMKLTLPDGTYVHNTDGIASTQQTSSRFVGGLFTAINDDTAVVGLSWQKIVSATGLNCEDMPVRTLFAPADGAITNVHTPTFDWADEMVAPQNSVVMDFASS